MATAAQRAARRRRRQNRAARRRASQPVSVKAKRSKRPVGTQSGSVGPRVGVSSMAPSKKSRLISEVTRIPYREECIGPISTAINFTNTTYILNAANSTTFPWLSALAAKYEYYKFNKLMLKFVSSSADAVGSTNTALGTMIFNTNYDVLDTAFTTQIQMEDYGGGRLHAETVPSRSIVHMIEPNGERGGVIGGFRYCLPSAAQTAATVAYPSSSSAHDYDIGLMQCASVGAQAASVAGRLYICYQVDLANPKLDTPLNQSALAARWSGSSTGADSTHYFGTAGSLVSGSNIVISVSNQVLTLPLVGRYNISGFVAGTVASGDMSFTLGSGVTSVTPLALGSGINAAATAVRFAGTVDVAQSAVTGGTNTITFGTTTFTTVTSSSVSVAIIPSGLSTCKECEETNQDDRITQLEAMVARLTSMISSSSSSSSSPCLSVYEKQVDGVFETSECKSPDLTESVHLPRSLATQLRKSIGLH